MITQQLTLPAVFFVSGFASLLFQVCWQRALTFYYGVGSISVTMIVSIYMLGLGIGAYLGGQLADRSTRKLLCYVIIECTLAAFGFVSLAYLDWLGRLTAGAEPAIALLCMALFLLTPTIAMGMTLPMVTKIFDALDKNLFHSLSVLYSLNTLGAALGALFGSFVLICTWGLTAPILVASTLDLLIAAVIVGAHLGSEKRKSSLTGSSATPSNTSDSSPSLVANEPGIDAKEGWNLPLIASMVFCTGFLSIGYEIVWFRVIQLFIKPSAYSFSAILFVYLLGIAAGSRLIDIVCRKAPNLQAKQKMFCALQAATAVFVLISIGGLYQLIGISEVTRLLVNVSFGCNITEARGVPADIFIWPFVLLFIPTMFMGASFPLITSLWPQPSGHEGRTVGTSYFCTTVGNVMGGLVTGWILLPYAGTELTLCLFILVGTVFAAFWPGNSRQKTGALVLPLIAIIALCTIFPHRSEFYGRVFRFLSNRDAPDTDKRWQFEEGLDGTVATVQTPEYLQNYINGLTHGRKPDYKYYREAVEMAAYAPHSTKILVVGFGTGSTTEMMLKLPDAQQITVVELNKTCLANLQKFDQTSNILRNPKLTLVVDDIRRYLLSHQAKFDVVAMDPLRSTEAYSNNIYSLEFFQIAREHMSDDGILLVWLDNKHVLPKTVASVFPYVRVYNYFLLARNKPFEFKSDQSEMLMQAFSTEERTRISAYETKFLFDQTVLHSPEFAGYPINTDLHPVCEYFRPPIRVWKTRSKPADATTQLPGEKP